VLAHFFIDCAEIQYEPPLPDANYWRMQIHFAASNNVAEYEALVHGLKVSKDIGIRRIICFDDSDLVIQ
jgi:ribonuclease HI